MKKLNEKRGASLLQKVFFFGGGIFFLFSFIQALVLEVVVVGKSRTTITLEDEPGRYWLVCVAQLVFFFLFVIGLTSEKWLPLVKARADRKSEKKRLMLYSSKAKNLANAGDYERALKCVLAGLEEYPENMLLLKLKNELVVEVKKSRGTIKNKSKNVR